MKRPSTYLIATVVLLAVFAGSSYSQREPSEKQLLNELTVDVLNLQRQVDTLQKSVDGRNDAVTKLLEQVLDRFAPISASMQKLGDSVNGIRTDHTTASRDSAELRKVIDTVRSDIGKLSEQFAGINTQLRMLQESVGAMKVTETPLPSAGALFAQAYSDYSASNYSVAISGFKDYLAQYPKDSRAPSALYYVGMSYAQLREYSMAVDTFDELLQKYPGSDRTCGALLEKGRNLGSQKKIPEARATLQQTMKECPAGTPEVTNAAAVLKALPLK